MNIIVEVINKVEECFLIAEKFYGSKIPRAEIKFDLTGTTAGTSQYSKRLLRFNRKLLIENKEHFLTDVCQHEISHHITRWQYGYSVKSHGPEWKRVMADVFGLAPTVRHSLNTASVTKKKREYVYSCECLGKKFSLGAIRHKRVQRGKKFYCKKCKKELVFDGAGIKVVPTLREIQL